MICKFLLHRHNRRVLDTINLKIKRPVEHPIYVIKLLSEIKMITLKVPDRNMAQIDDLIPDEVVKASKTKQKN